MQPGSIKHVQGSKEEMISAEAIKKSKQLISQQKEDYSSEESPDSPCIGKDAEPLEEQPQSK